MRERETNTAFQTYRNKTFDVAKGLGILMMVLRHAGMPISVLFLYFHMPLFFIISGCFFKEKCYSDITSIWSYIKRKIKTIAIPFIIINVVLTVLHNFFISHSILTDNQDFLLAEQGNKFGLSYTLTNIPVKILYTFILSHGEQLAGATWFLRVMFWISIFFCLGSFLLNKLTIHFKTGKYFEHIRFFICLGCLFLGLICQKHNFNFYSIGTMLSSIICFELGILYQKHKDKIPINLYSFLSSVAVILIVYKIYPNGIGVVDNKYDHLLEYLLCAISGFIITIYLAKFISKFSFVQSIFSYIGSRTLVILCLHLIAFKFIVLLQINIYKMPDYMLASFPVLIPDNFWWLAYTFVGIAGPLLIEYLYRKIKATCLHRLFEN